MSAPKTHPQFQTGQTYACWLRRPQLSATCVPTAIRATARHAAVRCKADERQRLVQQCRHITRPRLANERLQINNAGQMPPKFMTAWRDGTTHSVLSPLQFLHWPHLIRFHGVLAPNDKLRAMVVPHDPEQATGKSELTATGLGCAHGPPTRIRWARLLKHEFHIDLEHCPNCGGQLKIIATILESAVIERIWTHLGLPARAPPRVPARGDFEQAA